MVHGAGLTSGSATVIGATAATTAAARRATIAVDSARRQPVAIGYLRGMNALIAQKRISRRSAVDHCSGVRRLTMFEVSYGSRLAEADGDLPGIYAGRKVCPRAKV